MPQIMISYRRADSRDIAGRIFDRLATRYGREAIFRDIDSNRYGADFKEQISETLRNSDIVLAIVGPHWLGRDGEPSRFDDPDDLVRIEIETALASGIMLIPIFVGGAAMPAPERLPASVRRVTSIHGQRIDSEEDFDDHVQRLCRNLDRILAEREQARHKAEPAEPQFKRELLQRPIEATVGWLGRARQGLESVTTSLKPAPASPGFAEPLRSLRFHAELILSLAFAPDGRTIASASLDRTTKIWDVGSGATLFSLIGEPRCPALAVAFAPDGQTLAVGGEDGSLGLFEAATGTIRLRLTGFPGIGHWLRFSPNGRVIRAGAARVVRLWDLDFPEQSGPAAPAAGAAGTAIQPAGAGRFALLNKVFDRTLDMANELKLKALFWSSGQSTAVSADERIIAEVAERTVVLRETGATQPFRTLAGAWGPGSRLAISPDGAMLAVASWLQPVRLWDVATGATLATLGPATIGAWTIAFSPGRRLLATAGGDKTIALWDISRLAQAGAPAPSGAEAP